MDAGGVADGGEHRITAGTILHFSRAADEGGRAQIFVLGPFASRVNFFRQQNRALNLVWALGQMKHGNKNVAVIGGGLAGVTAALALRGIACNVTLYDRGPSLMWRQREAHHRVAHPSVNFWPDLPLQQATDFPFLNWVSTSAGNIAADLKPEWDRVYKAVYYRPTTTVKKLVTVDSGISVETDKPDYNDEFDYVIVATGFDDEKVIPGIPHRGYWEGSAFRIPTQDEKPVFVSGAGDGGLIEALSLVHTQFEAGRLIIQTAQRLFEGPIVETLVKGEREIREKALKYSDTTGRVDSAFGRLSASKGWIATGAAKDLPAGNTIPPLPEDDRHPPHALNQPEAVKAREELYARALRLLPPDVLKELNDSLNDRPGVSVYLIADLAAPYRSEAAPIHKLLVAHAIRAGKIRHLPSWLTKTGVLDPKPDDIVFDPDRTVPRLGAGFNVALLTKDEITHLRARQGSYIDELDKKWWLSDAFSTRFERKGSALRAFLLAHIRRAQRLSELLPSITVCLSRAYDSFEYQVVDSQTPPPRPPVLPLEIFGVPLKLEPITSGQTAT